VLTVAGLVDGAADLNLTWNIFQRTGSAHDAVLATVRTSALAQDAALRPT